MPDQVVMMQQETVVLLHGIARTGWSMRPVANALKHSGYQTISITYPSLKRNLDEIAGWLNGNHLKDAFWQKQRRIHFVTHSMGGLVARRYLETYRNQIPAGKLGHVVMMAPPNGGSEIADLLHGLFLYRWFYGPAGQELTTRAQAQYGMKPYYSVGVIAGTACWPYPVARRFFAGANDGRVAVERTCLADMADHITVNATHTFILHQRAAQQQIIYFLKNGCFNHGTV